MHPFVREAVPAVPQRSFAESFPILSAIVIENVVLARHKENIVDSRFFGDLTNCVELSRF